MPNGAPRGMKLLYSYQARQEESGVFPGSSSRGARSSLKTRGKSL